VHGRKLNDIVFKLGQTDATAQIPKVQGIAQPEIRADLGVIAGVDIGFQHFNRRPTLCRQPIGILQALFQMEAGGQSVDAVCREFEEYRFGADLDGGRLVAGDPAFFRDLTENAVKFQPRIDQMANQALAKGWPIDRIDPTLRALFRAAGAELIGIGTAPKVVISEFIDVAKAFFPEGKEPKFVNAVLDRMAREVKPEAF